MATYKCSKCGKIVQVEFDGAGNLSCCGQEMIRLAPRSEDASTEKHVPYVQKVESGVKVRIGKDAKHPMTDDHYIVYIQICADGVLMRKYLEPGDEPEAFFRTDAKIVRAQELCNVHGLWVD